MSFRYAFCAMLALSLSACASIVPDQPKFDNSVLMPKMVAVPGTENGSGNGAKSNTQPLEPNSCKDFETSNPPGTKDTRNTCIVDLMLLIDNAYQKYAIDVNNHIGATNFSLDAIVTFGSAASTASTGATAKVLSAISSVASGSKTAISEDLLYKATVQVLLTTMQANREKDAAAIKLSMQQDISTYPMNVAKGDILKYLNDGTLISAFASLNQNANATAQTCTNANQAVSTATKTGTLSAAQAKTASAQSTNSATTTTQAQCAQITMAVSYKMDTSPQALALLSFTYQNNATDKDAVKTLTGCFAKVPQPTGFDKSKYQSPDGNIDFAQIITDPSVDEEYKTNLLACTKNTDAS